MGTAPQVRRTPWLVFLFLTAVFFVVYHDLSYSVSSREGLKSSENNLATVVAQGSVVRRVALLSLGLFTIISLFRGRVDGRLRIDGALGWLLLGFAAWAVLSLIWAEDPPFSFRRLVAFVIVCLAAAAIGRRFSFREIVLWTFWSSALYIVVGVLAEVFLGTFRPLATGYRFQGTLPANSQGINCALLVLSAVAAAQIERHRRTIFRGCALVGFAFLILTASRTSIAACLFSFAVYAVTVGSRATRVAMAYSCGIAFCLMVILGGTFLPKLQSAVFAGRDISANDTFNGRTGIWDDVGSYVRQRPILGYGYGGFWTPARIREVSDEENWAVPDGHSAYLDYLLTLGLVGLIAYVLLLISGITRAFRLYRFSRRSSLAFFGVLLLFCALDGFLESAMTDPSILMFLSTVILTRLAFMSRPEAIGAEVR